MLVPTTMQASHVSRFGPFLNRCLLHSKTLTNRHQCRHNFSNPCRQTATNESCFSQRFPELPWVLGRTWTPASHLDGGADGSFQAPSKQRRTHTHTLTTRTITNANTTLWTAGRSSLQNSLHSDFLALQEDTHGWTARTGKCALMVPVERLASTHQTFVKQTFWEMTEQRFAPERRPGGVCTRGPTLFVQSCGSSQ